MFTSAVHDLIDFGSLAPGFLKYRFYIIAISIHVAR